MIFFELMIYKSIRFIYEYNYIVNEKFINILFQMDIFRLYMYLKTMFSYNDLWCVINNHINHDLFIQSISFVNFVITKIKSNNTIYWYNILIDLP